MPTFIRFLLRLDKEPKDNLARVIMENDSKINISDDGIVSINMDNPDAQQGLIDLIKGFKDVPIESSQQRGHAA